MPCPTCQSGIGGRPRCDRCRAVIRKRYAARREAGTCNQGKCGNKAPAGSAYCRKCLVKRNAVTAKRKSVVRAALRRREPEPTTGA